MKKTIAILLSVVLLSAMLAVMVVPASADATNVALNAAYADIKLFNNTYNAKLTDGVAKNELTFDAGDWFAFCINAGENGVNAPNGVGTVVIDLGKVCDITSFKVNAVVGNNVEGAGIYGPKKITASVSDSANGTFTAVGELTAGTPSGNVAWFTLDKAATGRFVKIEVTVDTLFAFINEIEVYGAAAAANTGDDNTSADTTPVLPPREEIVPDIGDKNKEAKFDLVIDAPETYKAGEEVVVTVTVKNATTRLHNVHGELRFDNKVLGFSGSVADSKAVKGALKDFGYVNDKGVAEWEDFTRYRVEEDGTIWIELDALTGGYEDENGDYGYTDEIKDGDLVFTIKFVAKKDATGAAVVTIDHDSVTGKFVDPEPPYETAEFTGNGSYAVIYEYVEPTVDEPVVPTADVATKDEPGTGDASSMIFFAIIALVAIAGSAVVIKTRK